VETKEMETSLSRLKKQLASLAEQTTSLDAEANDLRDRITRLHKDKSRDMAIAARPGSDDVA